MAKILVADDNSNVQKTMALALADLGVELVSVNNGEAAVRKLADVSPDLVLADIFMPVRNGYEVCEYVKKDARFSHVPVVLLVGAFDPLDEREAQRVGADGILKKPFVPPDPLIAMVKTLLDRSMSERLVAVSVSKTSVAVHAKAESAAVSETRVAPSPLQEEASPEEFSVTPGRVSFGEGDRPVAFGQLLETPVQAASASGTDLIEPVDDEQILTSSRDATLGEPVFWRNDSPEAEPEVEPSNESPNGLLLRKWGQDEDSLSKREDSPLLEPLEPIEPLELVHEEQEEAAPSHVDSEPIVLDPAAQSPLTVESGKAPELAANPIEWLATAPQQQSDAAPEKAPRWDEQIADGFKAINAVELLGNAEAKAQLSTPAPNERAVKITPEAVQAPEDTAKSVPIHKWAEMTDSLEESASEAAMSQAVSIPVPVARVSSPALTIPPPSPFSFPEPPKATVASDIGARSNPVVAPGPPTLSSVGSLISGTSPNPSAPPVPDPALVEAVVQRVLDKMRPQVVDIITREFLRPVVQALVHREIEKH